MTEALYDVRGTPIFPGDTLKVYHFTAALRREKRYMYKYVLSIEPRPSGPSLMKVSHLNPRDKFYWLLMDGRRLPEYEVVQGYGGVSAGQDFRDRARHNSEKAKQ